MKTRPHKNRNKSRAEAPRRDNLNSKDELGARIVKVALAAILGAAGLLTVMAVFMPIEDAEEQALDRLPASSAGVSENTQSLAGLSETNLMPSMADRSTSTRLDFPSQPEPIEVGQLQAELRDLALRLQSDYSAESGAFHFAAQIYSELNQTEEAEKAWRKSLSLPSPAAGPYAGLASLLVADGRESEALELLEQAHAAGIQSPETQLKLAEAQENLGQLAEAEATLVLALDEYADDADMWLARGRVLNQLNDYEGAEKSLLASIRLGGESESTLFLLTTAQLRQGKRDLAAETSQRLKRFREQGNASGSGFQENYESALRGIAVEVFISAAALAEKCQRLEEAEKLLWRAIQLVPGSSQAYMSLSSVLRKLGKLSSAVQVHQQLVEIQPDNLLNYSNLASLALQNREIELARNTLFDAMRKDPGGVAAQALLAKLYLAEGQFTEAKKYAGLVLERNRSVESYLLMASIYEAEGDSVAANNAIAEAQALDPLHPIWKSE